LLSLKGSPVLYVLLALQSAQPPAQPAAQPAPDIELNLNATARRVEIQNRGNVSLEMRSSLNGAAGQGNVVAVEAPDLPPGRTVLENVVVRVRGEARIAPPETMNTGEEPTPPQ
jgi:hypothetical protein